MPKIVNLTGKKIGKLTVIKKQGKDKWGQIIWVCQCSCGNITQVLTKNLTSGNTKSCGCYRREKIKKLNKINKRKGKEIGTNHPLYKTWCGMKQRCYNKNHYSYKNYGGRGIRVSKSWYHSFEQFVKDMGDKPTNKHTIERIDNDKGYCKSNCKWATRKEQASNRRINVFRTYRGERLSLAEWAIRLNVKYITE